MAGRARVPGPAARAAGSRAPARRSALVAVRGRRALRRARARRWRPASRSPTRTRRRSPRSACASTGCRSRSSSRPRGSTLLSPEAMLARLDERLKLLTGGRARRTGAAADADADARLELRPARARTSGALFARLGVFAGGFTLEAAESVCDADLDTLGSLVDKSLVRRERRPVRDARDDPRVRARAARHVRRDGRAPRPARRRSSRIVLPTPTPNAFTREGELADELEADHDNLRAALDRLAATDPRRQLRLAGMLGWFWHAHSHLSEGRARLARSARGVERARGGPRPGARRGRERSPATRAT